MIYNLEIIRLLWSVSGFYGCIIRALLDIKQAIAEVILGVRPLLIQSKINSVKQFLKLNIKTVQNSKYTEFIFNTHNDPNIKSSILNQKFKDVLTFLKWITTSFPSQFSETEQQIIHSNMYSL